jgi:N6-adenosine-specific RNA methylase IME4
MSYNILVLDPAWPFNDKLTMSKTKRGAEAQYDGVMSIEDIKNLPIKFISAEDALLALWVPSSLLQEGLDVMNAWGFEQKQTHIWVKTKKEPLKSLAKELFNKKFIENSVEILQKIIFDFDLEETLAFGMGRLFRQTHEICLIGTKGNVYNKLQNKSQRSVHFYPVTKHSEKPELLQDMLDKMFPDWAGDASKCYEGFARRQRVGYTCQGNECPGTVGEDLRYCLWKMIGENKEMMNEFCSEHEQFIKNIEKNKEEEFNHQIFNTLDFKKLSRLSIIDRLGKHPENEEWFLDDKEEFEFNRNICEMFIKNQVEKYKSDENTSS